MTKEFVPYEIALELKNLGFDGKCFASYYTDIDRNFNTEKGYDARKKLEINYSYSETFDDEDSDYIINGDNDYTISAPLWQQVFDWFRTKHKLHGYVDSQIESDGRIVYGYFITITHNEGVWKESMDNYEDARLECINQLIELCKKI